MAKIVKRGNVILGKNGKKDVVTKERELEEGENFLFERAHEEGDYSYFCCGEYCRCKQ